MKFFIVLSVLLTIFISCGRKCYMAPPLELRFLLKEKGQLLSSEALNKLTLSYVENGKRKEDPYIKQSSPSIMMIPGINWLSGKNNIKTFYLEYPDSPNQDTLFVNYKIEKSECGDVYTLAEPVRFNGKVVDKFDTTILKSCRVYVFEK